MLSIQPKISNYNSFNTVFSGRSGNSNAALAEDDKFDKELDEQKIIEEKYNGTVESIEKAKDTALELADKAPTPIKVAGKTLAITATALLSGMTLGWGGHKSIQAVKAALKTEAGMKLSSKVRNGYHAMVDGFKNSRDFIVEKYRNIKSSFKQTNFYNNVKNKYNSFFENTKFGRKLSEIKNKIKENSVYQKISEGISNAYNSCKNGITSMYRKIRGIKGEQVEKATVNTLGVSGAVSSGVYAINDKDSGSNINKDELVDL